MQSELLLHLLTMIFGHKGHIKLPTSVAKKHYYACRYVDNHINQEQMYMPLQYTHTCHAQRFMRNLSSSYYCCAWQSCFQGLMH